MSPPLMYTFSRWLMLWTLLDVPPHHGGDAPSHHGEEEKQQRELHEPLWKKTRSSTAQEEAGPESKSDWRRRIVIGGLRS
ncbi:hypothetical protein LR48_Vigan07g217700 [Vigna angularis]|uniref:Secreted protein n=1 Tax=Phaseolus angularis TaxID=3914 RepID=A0A0L9V0D4_PHAAN|nr:hypothetical protein LR48_Vigan07g217700 [Vigna angularis]